jgi:hypothetical protein
VARAFADGCYQNMQSGFNGGVGGYYGGDTWVLMEFMTGKAGSDLGQTEFVIFQNLNYDGTYNYFPTWWQQMYQGIGACNLAIQQIPGITASDLSDAQKANMLAEARTMRALYYFFLVRMFGAVPNITQLPTSTADLQPSRSPAKNIYDSIIIPDLLSAETSALPWSDPGGRVSMGAVESILADVYLTYAGAAINGGAQYYAESAKRSLNVIQNGGYTLFKNYSDMVNPANKNTGEFILQVQYSANANVNNPLTALTIHNYSRISGYSDEYGSVYPTDQFIASFPAGDKRLQERQFFYTSYPAHDGSGIVTFPHHYIYKWFDSVAVNSTLKSDLNYTLYRLADVKLMYAEASNRAEGSPNATAIQSVNDIRQRAGLAPIGAMSQTNFEQEVWAQRYFELCFENKMWFDIIRTLKIRNDATHNWDDFVGSQMIPGVNFQQKNLLFPLPLVEINANANLLPNNPGWQ